MKIECSGQIGDRATFILPGKQKPIPGNFYNLEKYHEGTEAQRKAFHALLYSFYFWMFRINQFQFEDSGIIYDFSASDKLKFKRMFLYRYCNAFEGLKYVDKNGDIQDALSWSEIPMSVLDKYNSGKTKTIEAVNKGWSDMDKPEKSFSIDTLIRFIGLTGCDDKKVLNGLKKMETNEAKRKG